MSFKKDFMRRHAEALQERRPMQLPAARTLLLHEQKQGEEAQGTYQTPLQPWVREV